MTSPSTGWGFGSDANGSSSLLRFDGARWEPVATPADWASGRTILQSSAFPMLSDATWFPAVGRSGNAQLVECASGQWRQVAWPYAEVLPLRIIPGASGELWGVGAIFHQQGCGPAHVTFIEQGVFLHAQQGRWSRVVLP